LSLGCCAEAFDAPTRATRFLPQSWIGENEKSWLYAAFYLVNGGMALALAGGVWARRGLVSTWGLLGLFLGAMLSLAIWVVFLTDGAAPLLLGQPNLHWPYGLVSGASSSLVAIALFWWGFFSTTWACVVGWWGKNDESDCLVSDMVRRLLCWSFLG